MSNFSKRIKALRLEHNLSLRQLEQLTNISHSSLSAYENERREPSFESLEALADVFNCDIDYILCRTDVRNAAAQERGVASLWEAYSLSFIPEARPVHRKRLQMLGNVACGEPIFAEAEQDSMVDADTDADFCLTAKGDSMINARIFDGDLLFVKQCDIVDDGEIAVVLIGDEATVKRFYYDRENNVVTLMPENPLYKPMRYTGADLDTIRVLGRVVAGQYKL